MNKILFALAVAAGIAVASSPAMAADAKALAQAKGCLVCHSADKKVIGPAYKDVAAKYKGDAGAAAKLALKVQKGGSGVWGTMPMPPNNVTPEEAKTLVTWVLSQK